MVLSIRDQTFTDDFCVEIVYQMSQQIDFSEANKERVAKMSCSNNCKVPLNDHPQPYPRPHPRT